MAAPHDEDRDRDPHPDQLNSEDRDAHAETPERPGSDEVRQDLEEEDRFEATDN
jgi:hypothetical protein